MDLFVSKRSVEWGGRGGEECVSEKRFLLSTIGKKRSNILRAGEFPGEFTQKTKHRLVFCAGKSQSKKGNGVVENAYQK